MALEWPPDLGTATIEGRVLLMTGDGSDADRSPDVVPGAGTVSVEASVKTVRYTGAQGAALFVKQVTSGVLDSEGYLCTKDAEGAAGVRGLIVPATDSMLLSPTDFTYTVKITVGTYSSAFSIAAPAGTTVDLAQAAPVPSSGGTAIVVDTSTADRAEAAAAAAEATVAGIDQAIADAVAADPDLRGDSAYETAVQQGFVGTEAEWIESLHGADGTATLPDTGWRINLPGAAAGTNAAIRRIGNVVYLSSNGAGIAPSAGVAHTLYSGLPSGFGGANRGGGIVTRGLTLAGVVDCRPHESAFKDARIQLNTGITGTELAYFIQWISTDAFPTILPGDPVA